MSLLCAVFFVATACSGGNDNIAVPVTTTEEPRQIVEPETTSAQPTTTTTTEAPPPPVAEIHVLGSLRTIPAASGPTATSPVLAVDDATIASLACTRSSGCEPTDLAAWAANTLDVVNLATSAGGVDGLAVLDEHAAALVASGIATAGYGADLASAVEPAIVGDPDVPLAVFAVSLAEGLPTELVATETTGGIAAGEDALAEIVALLDAPPVGYAHTAVIVDFGLVEGRAPSEEVSAQVQLLVDAGVDAVVVHGADFLQRFERIEETAVAFSLGNAATATTEPLRRDTAILRLVFEEQASNACLFSATGSEIGVGMDDPSLTDCP